MYRIDSMLPLLFTLVAICAAIVPAISQPPKRATISDESKVPPYTLPDPLICLDGTVVKDANTWRSKRRPEILHLCQSEWFGKTPYGRPAAMRFVVRDEKKDARNGKATRLRIGILLDGTEDGRQMELLLYLPNNKKRAPVILALNFDGNYTTTDEPDIPLPKHWVNGISAVKTINHQAAENLRGSLVHSWQYDYALEHGYGVATIGYGEIEPDYDGGAKVGFRAKDADIAADEGTHPEGDRMGAIGEWAWALSRAMDYLETNPHVDAKRVAVQGHSPAGQGCIVGCGPGRTIGIGKLKRLRSGRRGSQ